MKVQSGEEGLRTSMEKGNFGEMVQDEYYRQFGYERISKDMVISLKDGGHQGIDGIYHNPNGHPPYIISEAKYGTSRLSKRLVDGTDQMDYSWIDKRLEKSVGKEIADEIRFQRALGNVQNNLFKVKKNGKIFINQLYDTGKNEVRLI